MTRMPFLPSAAGLAVLASVACRDTAVEPSVPAASDLRRPVTWRVTALAGLGGSLSSALAINNRGQVVGFSTAGDGKPRAVFWDRGRVIELTRPGEAGTAKAINDLGQVIGEFTPQDGSTHGFLWHRGVRVDLGTLGGHYTSPTALNQRGQVVGFSARASGDFQAFFWQNGIMTDLDSSSDLYSYGMDINDRGQALVAGQSHFFIWQNGKRTELVGMGGRAINNRGQVVGDSPTQGLVLWQRGVVTSLGSLGNDYASALDINDRGEVTGESPPPGGQPHAFLWKNGSLIDLGTLGGTFSTPYAMNRWGQVVGASSIEGGLDGPNHPYVWDRGVMTDLGLLTGDAEGAANGINMFGQIVGSSLGQSGRRAVVWTRW